MQAKGFSPVASTTLRRAEAIGSHYKARRGGLGLLGVTSRYDASGSSTIFTPLRCSNRSNA